MYLLYTAKRGIAGNGLALEIGVHQYTIFRCTESEVKVKFSWICTSWPRPPFELGLVLQYFRWFKHLVSDQLTHSVFSYWGKLDNITSHNRLEDNKLCYLIAAFCLISDVCCMYTHLSAQEALLRTIRHCIVGNEFSSNTWVYQACF